MDRTCADQHCSMHDARSCIVEETIALVLASMDMEAVLDRTAKILRQYFGKTRVGITLLSKDEPGMVRVMLVDDPEHPTPSAGELFQFDGSLCGLAMKTREVQILEELDPDSPRFKEEQFVGQHGYGSLACFPLVVEQQVLGTLDIAHIPRHGLVDSCLNAAQRVAQLLAIALHNSMLMEEVRRLNQLLDRENTYLKDQLQQSRQSVRYVAESPIMKQVLEQVTMVAATDTTVFIRGETGTGKEGLARMVHEASLDSAGPFIVVNLGSIPESLIESELFGHEKGAFTGADRRKLGRFEQAAGGTIFLDEVGDAPMPVQVKLLRALQERQIERVGGTGSISVNVRVVAATNRDLERLIEEGLFRLDLFYRLSSFPIHLPPLRQRQEDIEPLVSHLLKRHATRMHRAPPEIPAELWPALEAHSWPGNIRELENYIERALILTSGSELAIPALVHQGPARSVPASSAPEPVIKFHHAVRQFLQRALEASEGKIYGAGGAAELLGIKPTTLQGKLKRYDLRR